MDETKHLGLNINNSESVIYSTPRVAIVASSLLHLSHPRSYTCRILDDAHFAIPLYMKLTKKI